MELSSSSSSSAPFKRARAPGSANQAVPSCLVDGCTADLSKCRDYHRRHKVCEVHSKTPKVTIRGQEQRFCQQCSRFHSLVEFDEVKRSCRKRLDGHNRRRRKPQPDSLSVNSGGFLSGNTGSRYLPFSSTEMYSSWVGAVKAETDMNTELNFSRGTSLFPGLSPHNYKGEKQISFIQSASSSLPAGVSVCQPLLDANPSTNNDGRSSSRHKMFSSNGLNQVINSNRALSLLSSQPPDTQVIGLSSVVQSAGPASSFVPNLHYNNSLGTESEQLGTILSGDGISNNTNLHGLEMFRTGHSGASASGAHQTLSFTWE